MARLSKFKKMVGNLGKKLYYMKEPKYPINILAVMEEGVIEEYALINNKDYEKGLKELENFLNPAAEQLMTALLLNPAVGGIAFKSFMTKELEDIPWLMGTLLFAMFGKKAYNTIFGKRGFKLIFADESEEKVPTVVVTWQKCPFCCNVKITKEDLKSENYGKIIEVLLSQTVELVEEFVENKYKVICKETKCFLRGDSVGEYRIWLYPEEEFEEKIKLNKYI